MSSPITKEEVAAIKGRMVSLTFIHVFSPDLEQLDQLLQEKVSQAPKFFRGAPIMIDLGSLKEEVNGNWLEKAWGLMKANNFVPVGITGVDDSFGYVARALNIAVWPTAEETRHNKQKEPEQEPRQPPKQSEPEPVAPAPAPEPPVEQPVVQQNQTQQAEQVAGELQPSPEATLVIKQPVRSGQKVYAKGRDLLVLASVSTGAEILADGHIHVYGSLRGRAFAGAQGNEEARIFCTDLQADLVSIAGIYMINDDLPDDIRKTAVQISLAGEELKIEPLL